MSIMEEASNVTSDRMDRVAACLRGQAELIRQLVHDIETEPLTPQGLKHRIHKIEDHWRRTLQVI